jgi:predicted acetyltransferase
MKTEAHLDVVAPSPDEEPLLANLLELYAHDFSEFFDLDIGEDGRFGYRSLHLYWSEPRRHPFFIRVDGKPAGLVFVRKGSELSGRDDVWDMAEFFVVRGCRRRGIGMRAAHEIWKRFPGMWEVRVMQANVPAQRFWGRAASLYAGEAIVPVRLKTDAGSWMVFSFEAGREIG